MKLESLLSATEDVEAVFESHDLFLLFDEEFWFWPSVSF